MSRGLWLNVGIVLTWCWQSGPMQMWCRYAVSISYVLLTTCQHEIDLSNICHDLSIDVDMLLTFKHEVCHDVMKRDIAWQTVTWSWHAVDIKSIKVTWCHKVWHSVTACDIVLILCRHRGWHHAELSTSFQETITGFDMMSNLPHGVDMLWQPVISCWYYSIRPHVLGKVSKALNACNARCKAGV